MIFLGFRNFIGAKISFLVILSITCACVSAVQSDSVFNYDLSTMDRQPQLPRSSYEEEYKLFLSELENGTAKNNGKSRQKRYVYLNTETNLDVGLFIVIPVTIVLPSMSNLFNVWRRKRSLDNFNFNTTSDETDPFVQSQLDRVSAYFELMNIPEKSCQLRAICDLSAEPTSYFPVSDVILSKLRDTMMVNPKNGDKSAVKPSLFQLYAKAVDDGASMGKQICNERYAVSCKYSIEKLLNMPVIKFWNKLQSKLRLKFEDDLTHQAW